MKVNCGNAHLEGPFTWGCVECRSQLLRYVEEGYPICCDCESSNVYEQTPDPVNLIPIGVFPDGKITSDLGWAGIAINKNSGVASVIGISGFDSSDHFKQWAVSTLTQLNFDIGVLEEWEPVEMVLYECWMPSQAEQFPDFPGVNDELRFSYCVWRQHIDPDAKKVIHRSVYALQHKTHFQMAKANSELNPT